MSTRELFLTPVAKVLDLSFLNTRAVRIALFVACSVLLIVPIWLVKYPPLVDYPNHLARAFILHHLHDPNYHFGQFYAPDWGLNPYCLADALMQVFLRFVGIYTAGRLLLTLCILGGPLAVAFFLRRANPGNEYLALWAFAIAYNPNFLLGFMAFELSIALCFVVVGVWLDYMRTGQTKYWILSIVLATGLFLTHLGGFGVAGLVIVLYTLLKSGISQRLVEAGIVFVPGSSFFLYAKLHDWSSRGFRYKDWYFIHKLGGMLVPFSEYTRSVELITLLAILATIAYFLWRKENLRIQTVWMAVAAAIVAVHWVLPGTYGDLGFIDYRFCIFAFLFALAIPSFSGSRTLPILLASLVILVHLAQAGKYFVSEQKHLASIAQNFQYIPRNALVLAYTGKGDTTWVKGDDLHFWGYGVIERGWITPSVFHQEGVQPLQLRVPMYSDDDQYGYYLLERKYDIYQIGKSYDYLWTSNTSYLDPYLDKIADPIHSQGELQIFKSRERAATVAEQLR